MKIVLAVIAAVLAIIGNVPYLRDVIRKRVQPHPYTWFVWCIVTATTFFGQFAKGAGVGALPTAVSESFTVIIFLCSLRYGFKNIQRIDTVFLVVALLGLLPWVITKDPTISVVVVVIMDLIAFAPSMRKTWDRPSTETPLLYAMNVLRHVLTLFSLEAYNIATMLHSIAMIAANTVMTMLIVRRTRAAVP